MSFDPTYAAEALLWAGVWGSLGLTARVVLARADVRRQQRSAGKGASENVR